MGKFEVASGDLESKMKLPDAETEKILLELAQQDVKEQGDTEPVLPINRIITWVCLATILLMAEHNLTELWKCSAEGKLSWHGNIFSIACENQKATMGTYLQEYLRLIFKWVNRRLNQQ